MQLDPNAVLAECQQINPMVVDLAMERVARRRLEEENARLRDALEPDAEPEPAEEPEPADAAEDTAPSDNGNRAKAKAGSKQAQK